MDLQNIQDQLNTEFAKSEIRIIFWFDDKGEYEDEVSELQLGDVKLHILDGTNWLYSKYLLNEQDKESKYLVYAAFAKPSDAKRVYIIIKDDGGNVIESKIDLGVHANMNIEQDTYCFDVCMDDEGASLLINSCEQIFAEKLRSLLRFGPLSTRYKDIFDFCYLKDHVDMPRLASCIKTYIIDEPSMREKDMNGVCKRVALTFSNRQFRRNVEHSGDRNWLQIDVGVAFKMIQDFLETFNL